MDMYCIDPMDPCDICTQICIQICLLLWEMSTIYVQFLQTFGSTIAVFISAAHLGQLAVADILEV